MAELATGLLLIDLDGVALLHLQRHWRVVLVDSLAVEPKSNDLHGETLEGRRSGKRAITIE